MLHCRLLPADKILQPLVYSAQNPTQDTPIRKRNVISRETQDEAVESQSVYRCRNEDPLLGDEVNVELCSLSYPNKMV